MTCVSILIDQRVPVLAGRAHEQQGGQEQHGHGQEEGEDGVKVQGGDGRDTAIRWQQQPSPSGSELNGRRLSHCDLSRIMMSGWRFIFRSLVFQRRVNSAIALGVAAATAVLTGALLALRRRRT